VLFGVDDEVVEVGVLAEAVEAVGVDEVGVDEAEEPDLGVDGMVTVGVEDRVVGAGFLGGLVSSCDRISYAKPSNCFLEWSCVSGENQFQTEPTKGIFRIKLVGAYSSAFEFSIFSKASLIPF
jgi:hypothetical protein